MPSDIEKLFPTLNNFHYRPLFFWELRQEHENLIQSELAKIGFPKESDWLVIGPFDNTDNKGKISTYPPETEINFSATYQGSPSSPSPLPKGEGRRAVRWQKADDGKIDGVLDFTKIFTPTLPSPKTFGEGPEVRWVLAYALIDVISPDDRKAFLRIGSDDGVKVWLNWQIVWTNQVQRPLRFDEDVVPIELKQGNNRLLFKVDQGTGAWGLIVRITDETGQSIKGLRYQTPK
jgi:hypothetical protein